MVARDDPANRGRPVIYVDALIDWGWELGPSCHLIADSEGELLAFAWRIGLKRRWLQRHPRYGMPHFDLTARRRERALELGAIELGRREFVEKLRSLRDSDEQALLDARIIGSSAGFRVTLDEKGLPVEVRAFSRRGR